METRRLLRVWLMAFPLLLAAGFALSATHSDAPGGTDKVAHRLRQWIQMGGRTVGRYPRRREGRAHHLAGRIAITGKIGFGRHTTE